MSTRRAAKKAVDYSQFCDELEDYSGDDDDFQDSPNPPPSKKTKSSKASPKKNGKKGKATNPDQGKKEKEIAGSKRETKLSRLSVEEKVFNRELQAALELSSQGQANGAVNTGSTETSKKGLEIKTSSNGVLQRLDLPVEHKEDSEDESGKSDSDYQQDANERESDDSFSSEESDDEYDVPKPTKKALGKTGTKKQNSVKSKSGAQGKNAVKSSRVAPQISKKSPVISGSKASSARTGLQKTTPSKTKPVSNPTPFLSHLNTGVGPSRTVSPGLSRSNLSPGLGGVHVRQSNPGGIRLGLSRNIRLSKSLHPNAAHTT